MKAPFFDTPSEITRFEVQCCCVVGGLHKGKQPLKFGKPEDLFRAACRKEMLFDFLRSNTFIVDILGNAITPIQALREVIS